MGGKPTKVLIVEDDLGDAFLFKNYFWIRIDQTIR